MSGAQGLGARRAALQLLAGVLESQRTLGELTADPRGPLAALEPSDRARATALATGVLRHLLRIDTLIARFARRMPKGEALAALRLLTYEVLAGGVAPHAAVDSAVRLAGGKQAAGFVNAVGRRIAAEGAAIWQALPPGGPGPWLGPRLKAAWGKAALQAMSQAHEAGAALDLTPRDGDPARLAEMVGGEALPTGSVRLRGPGQVSTLPGYDDGAWWVQDAAAALPVRLLGEVAGLDALDICAAPGGKTLQLAAGGARVTAVDVSEARLARLGDNLARTGLAAGVVAADALAFTPEAPVDVVVLDAPCSATGTLRRHPDLPFVRPEPDLAPLLALQAALIDRAVAWLRPGGRLLYCTCSLLPEEGEAQAEAALARHPGLARLPVSAGGGIEAGWITAAGDLRLRPDFWPGRGGMDGFFACVLRVAEGPS